MLTVFIEALSGHDADEKWTAGDIVSGGSVLAR